MDIGSPSIPPPPPPLANGLQPLSCLRCARHKARCDRVNPCTRCTRAGVDCEFAPQKTGGRRKRATTTSASKLSDASPSTSVATLASSSSVVQDVLQSRLDLYQDKLRSLGVDARSLHEPTGQGTQHPPPLAKGSTPHTSIAYLGRHLETQGQVCPYAGSTTLGRAAYSHGTDHFAAEVSYAPGPGIFEGSIIATAPALLNLSTLPLGVPHVSDPNLDDLWPSQYQFAHLWRTYLRNVHPITMLIHSETASAALEEAVQGSHSRAKGIDVLMFAVMTAAVMSMTNEECLSFFGVNQATQSSVYRRGCELALQSADFIVSCNFTVLQAYTVFLFAVNADLDPRGLWSLAGLAMRTAQRLGLHRNDASASVTPFEGEMRRRLWHQITLLDAMSVQGTGLEWSNLQSTYDLSPPPNNNDSDFSPAMQGQVLPRVGATDMMFSSLRHKMFQFTGRINGCQSRPQGASSRPTDVMGRPCSSDVEDVIESMEKDLELSILRYCDMLSPLHIVTASVARLALCKQRFILLEASLHHQDPTSYQCMESHENLMPTALRVLEYENTILSHQSIRGFLWYTQHDFLWSCPVYILQRLKTKPDSPIASKAWEQIGRLYELTSDCRHGSRHKLAARVHAALREATLDGWRARERYSSQLGETLHTPEYISFLQGSGQHQANNDGGDEQWLSGNLASMPAPVPDTDSAQMFSNLDTDDWSGWPSFSVGERDMGTMNSGSSALMSGFMGMGESQLDHGRNLPTA